MERTGKAYDIARSATRWTKAHDQLVRQGQRPKQLSIYLAHAIRYHYRPPILTPSVAAFIVENSDSGGKSGGKSGGESGGEKETAWRLDFAFKTNIIMERVVDCLGRDLATRNADPDLYARNSNEEWEELRGRDPAKYREVRPLLESRNEGNQ